MRALRTAIVFMACIEILSWQPLLPLILRWIRKYGHMHPYIDLLMNAWYNKTVLLLGEAPIGIYAAARKHREMHKEQGTYRNDNKKRSLLGSI